MDKKNKVICFIVFEDEIININHIIKITKIKPVKYVQREKGKDKKFLCYDFDIVLTKKQITFSDEIEKIAIDKRNNLIKSLNIKE